MTAYEEKELIDSVERGEWKRVQNFSEVKRELMLAAKLTTGKVVVKKKRQMAFA